MLDDRRDRQAEDGAQVKLELVGRLADQGHHAGVVRARAQFGEDGAVAGDEEFDPEQPAPAERRDDLAGLCLRRAAWRATAPPAASFRDSRRLLPVADGGAEMDAVGGRDGEQGDLAVEGDELLDDRRGRSPRMLAMA